MRCTAFAAALLFGLCVLGAVPAGADSLQAVTVTRLRPVVWRETVDVSAAVDAVQEAVLAAQQSGRIVAVLYHSGQMVVAGQLLVQFDDAPQAAQLVLDQAKLAQAQRGLARETRLMSIAGASQAALEQAEADAAEAAAQVSYDRAAAAQLQVVAPFAGTLGIRKVSAGDYIAQGQEVARITQASPLRVMFSVPQTAAGGLALGDAFTLTVPSLPQAISTSIGHVTALSPQIDQATNARAVEGVVANDAGGLLPGMYGIASLEVGPPQPAYALPATALNDSTLGRYVYVLAPASAAFVTHAVYVHELSQSGSFAVIGTAGLAPDDQVVAIGGFNLSDGLNVTIAK